MADDEYHVRFRQVKRKGPVQTRRELVESRRQAGQGCTTVMAARDKAQALPGSNIWSGPQSVGYGRVLKGVVGITQFVKVEVLGPACPGRLKSAVFPMRWLGEPAEHPASIPKIELLWAWL